jgi:hypothetical protein
VKYSHTYAYRYALWRAYGMKCFYCGRPVDFNNVTIDHVLPQSLLTKPEEAERIIYDYDIRENFPDFSIDGLSNLVPSDGASCNYRKGDMLLPKPATLFYLTLVHRKMPKVLEEISRLANNSQKGRVLGQMSIALEQGSISIDEIMAVLHDFTFQQIKDEPLVVTLGLNIADVLEMKGIPPEAADPYPYLCDQLEEELENFIRSETHYSFHYPESSARDGETLSVRLVFPEIGFDDVDNLPLARIEEVMPWWNILEIRNFYQVYGQRYQSVD